MLPGVEDWAIASAARCPKMMTSRRLWLLNLFAPCTEIQAASPAAYNPGTTWHEPLPSDTEDVTTWNISSIYKVHGWWATQLIVHLETKKWFRRLLIKGSTMTSVLFKLNNLFTYNESMKLNHFSAKMFEVLIKGQEGSNNSWNNGSISDFWLRKTLQVKL